MTRFSFGWLGTIVLAALFVASSATLVSCGSGAVSAPPTPVTPTPISVSPSIATLYSDLPTTFQLSGGNGSYVVSSSDQSAIPVSGVITGSSLTVIPNAVTTDTPVTLTIGDTSADTPATATVTVKPRTVSNVITVTPSSSQPAACGSAICAGGDAQVTATLAVNGIALQGHVVRFDVVSGDVRIITSAPGSPEVLSTSTTTISDSSGKAIVRIRALDNSPPQTAIIQITDVSSGSFQRAPVTIAPSSNAALNAQPSTITFQGVDPNTCASGISADVIVFGGRPPYLISQPGSFDVSPTTVASAGGRFSVRANGQCSSGSQIAVVDSSGATVSVTATNKLSDVPATPVVTTFAVSPSTVSLSSCSDVGSVTLSGGSGSYIGTSGNTAVRVTVNNNIGTIQRAAASSAPSPTAPFTTTATFSDGKTTQQVQVTLNGAAATGACP